MKKKIIAASLACSLLLSALLPLAPVVSAVTASDPYSCLIAENDIPLHLLYDEEAPYGNEDAYATNNSGDPSYVSSDDDGWERWSIPLGNGYFGVNAFGRTETERLQITEKTLSNPYKVSDSVGVAYDGLNNFSETYIDFGHKNSDVTNYSRALDLKTAISTVEYTYNGVKYTREYFTSYPDKAIVIRLTADTAGALDFNLRPTVPYEQDYMRQEGDNGGKSGTVNVSLLDNDNGYGEICLKGNMQYYDIDFEACYRVMIEGGTISKDGVPNQSEENRNVGDEMLKVSGATSALILVTLGTNYELNSNVFTSATQDKIPDTNKSAHDKVTEEMQAILSRNEGKNIEDTYADIREAHVNDYSELFGRVSLDIATDEADYTRTTDELLSNYQAGNGGTYLEVLYFQYGRYLLIASSRSGALPANLQGTWNRYNNSPWSAGYWHNINEQMNYWPAFSTNLAETFESYVEYNQAYMQAAKNNASNIINSQYKDQAGKDGGNGWCLGNGWAYSIGGNDSAGNLGFMTELFWDYYQYTMDEELLEETVYPTLADAARFITKIMIVDEDGHYLVKNSDSPEQYYSGSGSGAWYYTQGTTYAQTFAYLNNYHTLLAAEILGKTGADDSILTTIAEQLDKYDPFLVGLSGQLKEFREEEYYGDIGEYTHRHISQLVGLYPGSAINDTTPAWLDAARYSLTERGLDISTGWGLAHRMNLWARIGDGDQAYTAYKNLLSKRTATNLWDLHPPFQIDGNFGGTSGVAEMLLQSHAGYIEPLAALPDAWQSGSYTGLVARGNFVVGAAWENGVAKTFNITSNAGGTCSVSYCGIGDAKVVTSKGKTVGYTRNSADLISFETEKGETYIISGMKAKTYSEPVSALEIAEETVESTTLVWNNASGAVKYNIYKAVEDAATYTYVGTTTANIYVVASDKGEENARTTFCVTAVSADGTESDRKLVYRNPHDPAEIENASLIALESGKLQAVIQASGDVEQYTFYRKASGSASYTEIANSEYPVIIYDGVYDAESSYAVSVTCAYTGKTSELFEFDGIGDASLSNFGYTDNIFENADGTYKKFTGDTSMISPTSDSNKWYYGYENLTDGSFNGSLGRFALAAGKKYDMVATIDLDGVYLLDAMKIYDFVNSGEITRTGNCTLEVYHDGKWTKVTGFTDVKLDEETGTGHYGNICTTWNIADTSGTVIAEKLRLTFEHVEADKGISIYEIVCSGTKIASANATVDNIFKNADGTYKKFTGDDSKCHTSAYAYDKLTDGDTHYATGRFSLKAGETTMEATMDLGGIYILDTLRINDFRNANDPARADDCKVEVYINGTWTTVLSGKSFDDERSGGWISWDLGGVRAEKIRLTFANTTDATKYPVSINEIECSGRRSPEKSDSNALAGLTSDKLTLDNATAHPSTSVKNISNAFDGDTGTRFAVLNGTGAYSLTMELGESTPLYTLRIYDFRDGNDKINGALATRSDETTVELRVDGKWYTFIDKQPMTVEKAYTDFYLGGVNADAIKITFNHTKAFDNESSPTARASIYEISCTTSSQSLDRSGALEALKNLDDLIENSSKDIFLAGASAYSKKARANLGSLTITEDGYNSMVSALAKWNSVFEGDTEYAFMVSGEDGVPTFYESVNATADGTKLQNVLNTLSASSTVTLLSDITWNSGTVDWNGTSSPMAGKTLEFDFNGMTVTLGTSTGSGTGSWLMHRCGMTAHYYSSRPGGKLISKNNKLVAFGQGSTSPVTVGAYEVDGKTISGDNLTIENLQLCDPWSGCTFTVDGGTYTHSADATGSMINVRSGSITIKNATLISDNSAPVINITDTAYATTTLENCMFVSTVDKNLIGGKDLSVGIVIKGGSFYGYTLNKYGASYTISDEPRFTAVDSALTSLTAARVREKKSELAPTASAVRYCIVRTASDASEVTWDYLNGNTLVEMWRVGEMPQNDDTRDIDGTDYYYQFKATDCVAKETKMTVAMEIASRSSKVLGNLTLYSDITFNLYFLKDGKISGITYDGKTTEFGSDCEVEIDGKTYYAYSISNMAPKDLYSSFTLDVVLEGESGVYRVKTSLAKYASSVLRGAADTEEGNAAKKLVLSLLDYVRETAVAFGGADEQHAGISAIDSLLEAYEYSRTEWSNTGNAQVPNKGNIVAGSLELGSAPGFAFTLAESYKDRDSVTLTVNGSQMTCEVLKRADSGNPYVLINRIHVSNYRDVIHISLDGHEFDYSFDAYMLGFDGVIPGYANALYTYSLAAENYLAATEEGE